MAPWSEWWSHAGRWRCFVACLLAVLATGVVSRLYYALVFLPPHHGGWSESMARLLDFEGWSAYVGSPAGLALNVLMGLAAVATLLLLVMPGRRGPRSRGRR